MSKILSILLLSLPLIAGTCHYETKKTDLEWKAYKTPLKIGVGGTFDKVSVQATKNKSAKEFFETTKITIDTASINSKNSGRDAKLVKSFFQVQNVDKIEAKVISVEKKIITVAISMNGITKNIPMKMDLDDKELEAEGYIDLADFNMLPSLKSINKACYDLHKGKTWQDVKIEIELELKKVCN